MIKSIRNAGIAITALITFLILGARIVWEFQTWECACSHSECAECSSDINAEWSEFHTLAVQEYEDEFTALFESIETKWSKNGRLMIRPVGAKSFKFAKRSA